MIAININPIALSLGGLEIRWYGILVALAVLCVLLVTVKEGKRLGISEDLLYGLFLWGIIGGLVMSRVVHVVDFLVLHPGEHIDLLRFDGLGLYGAVLGAPLAAYLYTQVHHIPWSSMARVGDAVALGAPLGQAIGRVGCLVNGCCHGAVAGVPWAVVYGHPASFCEYPGLPVHPTQVYFVIWNLAVFGVVYALRKMRKPEGVSFLAYLMLYAAGDFVIRFWRVNDPFAGGLQQGQVISLGIILACAPILWWKMRGFRAAARDESEPPA